MKYLILLMLLLVQTISYTQQTNLTESDRQKLIQGLENGDYSVLIPFISRDDTTPFIPLRNGRIVIRDEFEKPPVTKFFKFKNTDKTIIYTNQYGFQFLNDKEILWDLDEINSMPNAVCFGFYDMMKKAFKAKDPQDIISLYNEYSNQIFENNQTWFIGGSISELGYILDFRLENYSSEDSKKIFTYLFPIIYPTKKQQRIFLLNFPLNYIAIYNNSINTIRVHANDKVRSLLFSDNEEYKCLFKE